MVTKLLSYLWHLPQRRQPLLLRLLPKQLLPWRTRSRRRPHLPSPLSFPDILPQHRQRPLGPELQRPRRFGLPGIVVLIALPHGSLQDSQSELVDLIIEELGGGGWGVVVLFGFFEDWTDWFAGWGWAAVGGLGDALGAVGGFAGLGEEDGAGDVEAGGYLGVAAQL